MKPSKASRRSRESSLGTSEAASLWKFGVDRSARFEHERLSQYL